MILFIAVFGIVKIVGGVSVVPELSGCAVDYLTTRNIIANASESQTQGDDCDAKIEKEIAKFYDEVRELIVSGVNVDNLENSNFVNYENCIVGTLKLYNVSDLYLKGIAYERLNKVHRSFHSFNSKMTSQQIILLYALQVCEPRSFYSRHAEKIFTMNMRITTAQTHCLMNHLNEHSIDAPYQFNSDNEESIGDLQSFECDAIMKAFVKNYYNIIDRTRSFSIFGLNPAAAMKCRASNDKNLINHMILLTLFPRLRFTSEQMELEKIRFFEIARDSARSFFECISLYD